MSAGREYDQERLAELIMHVANRLVGDPRFGKTKLNKVLFFADFEAYRRTGRSITGAVYQHLEQGPCPHQVLPAIESLGPDLVWAKTDTVAGTQEKPTALRPARVDIFSGSDIAIVDEVIEQLRGLTNRQVSELSHETVAWRITATRDEVPYGAARISEEEPTTEDLAWLREVAHREGMEPAAG